MLLYTGPFFLLATDWCFNRMYLNVATLIFYPLLGYVIFFIYLEVTRVDMANNMVPEFSIFETDPSGLAYAIPSMMPVVVYLLTRLKFWFFDEGDYFRADLWKLARSLDQMFE